MSILKIAADIVNLRNETIAESILFSNVDLVKSNDYNRILIATHNVSDIKNILLLIEATKGLAYENKNSKIFIATLPGDIQGAIYSRFDHISGVFTVQRFLNLMYLIKALRITKILYSLDKSWQNQLSLKYKRIISLINVYPEDIIHSIELTNSNENIILLSNCGDLAALRRIEKHLKHRAIILSDKIIHSSKKQITPNTKLSISIGIGLLLRFPYIKCGNETSFFDMVKTSLY